MMCRDKILAALNSIFGARFTRDNVLDGCSGVFNGAYNAVIWADRSAALPVAAFNAIEPGRYPLNKLAGWLLGIGGHLHIPRDGEFVICSKRVGDFIKWNDGYEYMISFDCHIDHGFPYNPIGLLIHELVDVAGRKTRQPC